MKLKKEIALSVGFGALALAAGTLCHRLAPGLGLVVLPMFWPLAALATRVRPGSAVATAAIVPFVSLLLTGMPAFPLLVAVKFAALTGLVSFAWRLRAVRKAR